MASKKHTTAACARWTNKDGSLSAAWFSRKSSLQYRISREAAHIELNQRLLNQPSDAEWLHEEIRQIKEATRAAKENLEKHLQIAYTCGFSDAAIKADNPTRSQRTRLRGIK